MTTISDVVVGGGKELSNPAAVEKWIKNPIFLPKISSKTSQCQAKIHHLKNLVTESKF